MHLFLSALICLQTHFMFHLQLRMNACKIFFLSTLFAQVLTEAKNFHLNVRIMLDFPVSRLHCTFCHVLSLFVCLAHGKHNCLFVIQMNICILLAINC